MIGLQDTKTAGPQDKKAVLSVVEGRLFKLSRQVSNLNSSDPESDVLPVTPRDNFEVANINIFPNKKKKQPGSWLLH
jgi:hypothetical protein